MHRPIKTLPIVALGLLIAGCVSTQEMPLAPNIVRLDTHASGALFTGQTASQTMRRAAELTLQNGYTHFRLEQAQMSQGSQFGGVYSSGAGNAFVTGYGNAAFVSGNSSGFSTPIYRPTADVDVTVVMFHAGEAGAKGAFDAKAVLVKYSQ
jgi:hypothetical protein